MGQVTGQMFAVISVGLILLFCVGIILYGTGTGGFFSMAGGLIHGQNEQDIESDNALRLNELLQDERLKTRFLANVFTVGQSLSLSDDMIMDAENVKNIFVWDLVDVMDSEGCSLLQEKDRAERAETGGVSPVSYVQETGELCFYESGVYVALLRVWGKHGGNFLKKISIPVEEA
ncbi:hypothetical protein FACS1894111_13030 [Clostridia bacterium]|nr:hypothetical protein FACS1894111_13030 [Clostridia bacterium]